MSYLFAVPTTDRYATRDTYFIFGFRSGTEWVPLRGTDASAVVIVPMPSMVVAASTYEGIHAKYRPTEGHLPMHLFDDVVAYMKQAAGIVSTPRSRFDLIEDL